MYPLTLGFAVANQRLREETERVLHSLPIRISFEHPDLGDSRGLVERIERLRPEVILLDITGAEDRLADLIATVRTAGSAPVVVVLHESAQPDTILAAIRAGASEFLYPPLEASLRTAIVRFGRELDRQDNPKRVKGQTIGFLSAKGGCGSTTLACHVAVEMQRITTGEILLADVDLEAGMIGFLMRSKSPHSILDAANNISRLDTSYWKALVSNSVPRLDVVAAPSCLSAVAPVDAAQLAYVLRFVRAHYHWSVVDLGRALTNRTMSLLDALDRLFLVTTAELLPLQKTKEMIAVLQQTGFSRDRLAVLVNRVTREPQFTETELKDLLGLPVFAMLPNDYWGLSESYANGKLLKTTSHLGRQISRLASTIAGVPSKAENGRKFANWRLFR